MATWISIERIWIENTDIRPYGWLDYSDWEGGRNSRGHEFDLSIELSLKQEARRLTPRPLRSDASHAILWSEAGNWDGISGADPRSVGMPVLEWREIVRYYHVQPDGTWRPAGTHHEVDMFRQVPRAKTWGTFYPGIMSAGGMGWVDPWLTARTNRGNQRALTNVAKPANFDALAFDEKAYRVAELHRDRHPLQARITDRPGMQNMPVSGETMAGGIRRPLADTPWRSRVIHFDIGFAGTELPRVRVTQILETQAGVPTICKFIHGFCQEAVVCSTANHARWRAQMPQGPIRAPSLFNFRV